MEEKKEVKNKKEITSSPPQPDHHHNWILTGYQLDTVGYCFWLVRARYRGYMASPYHNLNTTHKWIPTEYVNK
jgi:hypothetical protein